MPTPIELNILSSLDSVRPYLQEDGGDIEIVEFREDIGILKLRFLGACKTCPMSMMTLRGGIERVLKKAVPEIFRVEAVL